MLPRLQTAVSWGDVTSVISVHRFERCTVLPGAPRVAAGPYRFLKHPNYLVVAIEIALLPLAFGLFAYAAIFSFANAAMLAWRIRDEDRALANQERPV